MNLVIQKEKSRLIHLEIFFKQNQSFSRTEIKDVAVTSDCESLSSSGKNPIPYMNPSASNVDILLFFCCMLLMKEEVSGPDRIIVVERANTIIWKEIMSLVEIQNFVVSFD